MKYVTAVIALSFAALGSTMAWAQAPADMAEAEIRKIDKDARKVTLKHGPIKSLDMPPMTMVFQIRDPAVLENLSKMAVGDKIRFSAVQQQGAYVVTNAEKRGAD